MGVSGTSPGIVVNDCALPINYDFVTRLSITGFALFTDFVGILDGAGQGQGSLLVPGGLAGLEADFAFVTFESGTVEFRHVSNAIHLTVLP
jgi:hypothetical protein